VQRQPTFGDPDEVAKTMVAALPVAHPFNAATGPFYDTPGLVKWLGITRQALHHRVKTGQLLACPTEDGHTVYPAWQFTTEGGTIPHLTALPQQWAAAFHAAGMRGVRYESRFSTAARANAVAVFGSGGASDWPTAESRSGRAVAEDAGVRGPATPTVAESETDLPTRLTAVR
jgi:hypothetical protein